MNYFDDRKAVEDNLLDAGCGADLVNAFFSMQGKTKEQMKILTKHRRSLLDKIHEKQEMLDCLDYLIYRIKKEGIRK